jgi:hypothetical protein
MPLLEVIQTRYISASIRLTDSTALQLDQYAAFIHASADEVIDQALAYVFSKDRDFQEYLRTPEAQRITPTLRRTISKEVGFSGSIGTPNGGIGGGIKGMIPRQHGSQSHDGATHRKNLDTPPLKGWCVAAQGRQVSTALMFHRFSTPGRQ